MKHKYALLYGSICAVLSLLFGLVFGVSILTILFRMILFFILATIVSYLLLICISNIFPAWLQKNDRPTILRNFSKIFRKKNSNTNNTEDSNSDIEDDAVEVSSSIGKIFDVVLGDKDGDSTVSHDDNTDDDNSGFEAFDIDIQRKQQQKDQKDVYNRSNMEGKFSKSPIRDAIDEEDTVVDDTMRVRREIDKNRRRLEADPQKFAGAISNLLKS